MADDDEDDCILAETAFRESGAEGVFISVVDGIELMEYLRRCEKGHDPMPSYILIDLNMPRMNGRQTLKEIKAVPNFKEIPIVIFTTSRQQRDIEFCLRNGAVAFISKPSRFEEWIEIMGSLDQVGTRGCSEKSPMGYDWYGDFGLG
jgi:two-component system response regulator